MFQSSISSLLQIWGSFPSIIGVKWTMPRTTKEILECWNLRGLRKAKMNTWNTMPSVIWEPLWKERVSSIFKRQSESLISSKYRCISSFFWCNMALVNDIELWLTFSAHKICCNKALVNFHSSYLFLNQYTYFNNQNKNAKNKISKPYSMQKVLQNREHIGITCFCP